MTQRELNNAVSRATGETVSEIARRGFVPLTTFPYEREPEDLFLDWDSLQAEQNTALYRQSNTGTPSEPAPKDDKGSG